MEYELSVRQLLQVIDPLKAWECEPLTTREVLLALRDNKLEEIPYDVFRNAEFCPEEAMKSYHLGRIAYLVLHPSEEAINLNYNSDTGKFIVEDGNHRLAAAMFRKLETIKITTDNDVLFLQHFPEANLCGDSPSLG